MTIAISYRDALSDVVTDQEELEFLLEFLDAYKNYGAFRIPKNLPSHLLINLIEKVKSLKEQQISFYMNRGLPATAANDSDAFEAENPPDAPLEA